MSQGLSLAELDVRRKRKLRHRRMEPEIGIDQYVQDTKYAKHRFDATACTEGMPGKGLRRAHGRIHRIEQATDSRSFREIVVLCPRSVEIDIADVGGLQAGALQGSLHGEPGPAPVRR